MIRLTLRDAGHHHVVAESPVFPAMSLPDGDPTVVLTDPAFAHTAIAIEVEDPALRDEVFAQPWPAWLATLGSIAVRARGAAPDRPALALPIALASPRGTAFLRARLDDFADRVAGTGWAIATPAHVVHGHAHDAWDRLVARDTRLVVVEREAGDAFGPGRDTTYSLLQLAAPEDRRIAFFRRFYREVLHDHPLDEAALTALADAQLPTSALVFDLLDGDADCLRPRRALQETHAALDKLAPHLGLDLTLEAATPLAHAMDQLAMAHANLDFTHEEHGIHAASDTLSHAKPHFDEVLPVGEAVQTNRAAQLWLERAGEPASLDRPLAVAPHDLCFQIAAEHRAMALRVALEPAKVVALFGPAATVQVDVVLYADPARLAIASPRLGFALARTGPSPIVRTTIAPRAPGVHRVRACLYIRGQLVQTLVADLGFGAEPEAPPHVDFTGVASFDRLDALPAIPHAIFVNDGPDDRHWIGVYSADPQQALGALPSGTLALADAATFEQHAADLRAALADLEGATPPLATAQYRFAALPLGQAQQVRADAKLLALAQAGRRMYDDVFENPNVLDPGNGLSALQQNLADPDRIISITRLDDRGAMPWALTYDLPLNPALETTLCTRFRDVNPATNRPFAESPAACAGRPDCPQKVPATAETTACPFGFWGFRHQLELRLRRNDNAVTPLDRVRIAVDATPSACTAAYAFPETAAHLARIGELFAQTQVATNPDLLAALRAGAASLYYFFCHGELAPPHVATLRFGANQVFPSGAISVGPTAAKLDWQVAAWAARAPLVFLNACESIAVDAQAISPFLDRFVGLGASALVGTEVVVFTTLAAQVAADLLARMRAGATLGGALLAVRRAMLGAGNPMGLAYAAYGAAGLRFTQAGQP